MISERTKFEDVILKSDYLKNKTVSGVVGAGVVIPGGLGIAFNYNFGLSNATVGGFIDDAIENIGNLKNQNMSLYFHIDFSEIVFKMVAKEEYHIYNKKYL